MSMGVSMSMTMCVTMPIIMVVAMCVLVSGLVAVSVKSWGSSSQIPHEPLIQLCIPPCCSAVPDPFLSFPR